MARRSDHDRVAAAFESSGRSVPFVCANSQTCVWLFPGGWHVGPTAELLSRLKDGARDSELYRGLERVEGDPLDRLRSR